MELSALGPTMRRCDGPRGYLLRHPFFPQTPIYGARTVEESVSPSQTEDTQRTSAYLCVGGPAWSPLSESGPAGSFGSPWIDVG